jgi:hypothetical protein
MQQSIVKFIVLSYRYCSTCFGHYYAHHQEPVQTAVAASGFRMNVEVEVFSAVVGLLVTNKPTTAENTSPPHSYGNQRLQRQFDGLLMMGIVMPET